jgi:hypothetical protein
LRGANGHRGWRELGARAGSGAATPDPYNACRLLQIGPGAYIRARGLRGGADASGAAAGPLLRGQGLRGRRHRRAGHGLRRRRPGVQRGGGRQAPALAAPAGGCRRRGRRNGGGWVEAKVDGPGECLPAAGTSSLRLYRGAGRAGGGFAHSGPTGARQGRRRAGGPRGAARGKRRAAAGAPAPAAAVAAAGPGPAGGRAWRPAPGGRAAAGRRRRPCAGGKGARSGHAG